MLNLKEEYSEIVEVPYDNLRFFYKGKRIGDDDLSDIFGNDPNEWKIIVLYPEQMA